MTSRGRIWRRRRRPSGTAAAPRRVGLRRPRGTSCRRAPWIGLPQSAARAASFGGDEESGVERMGRPAGEGASWGFYRAYRRTEGDKATEEQRRQGLLRSPRGSRQPASRSSAAQAGRAQIKKYEDACGQRRSFVGLGSKTQELFLACARNTRKSGALTPRL